MDQADGINVLLDLGTNGEVVVGGREGLLCTSTAAGPAFEGARIAQGMRAATGAISAVEREKDSWRCRVIGGGAARGICGSGLVDAVAVMLDLGLVRENGRFAAGVERLALTLDVALVQRDIRELQLAKGAVAAGMQTLVALAGAREDTIAGVHLAGAFGNYISRRSARRIGLLSFPPARVQPAGNTALLGAKLALFADDLAFPGIRRQVRHVSLRSDPDFADRFVDGMGFPGPDRDAPVQPVAAGAATVP